jgi:hypothetical protein
MRLFEPEAPSTSKSHRRRSGSRPNGDRMGRHWYPGFAAEGSSFRHAFTLQPEER